jgi:hypothetical protein
LSAEGKTVVLFLSVLSGVRLDRMLKKLAPVAAFHNQAVSLHFW